jgi:formylglycine-generating enzyme required for sulfatase activity
MEGVGVTFLEEKFNSSALKYHRKAAQAVLKALLPQTGTDIKGQMRSHEELLEAAGYATRPKEFHDLLRTLDHDVRFITPTDPDARESEDGQPASADGKYYQLTHDYLVPSLREWLTRKQKETRRGRAELRLADRAALWVAKPENRHLPSAWESIRIRLLTNARDWTGPQRKMMNKAARVHGVRGLMALLLLVGAIGIGVDIRRRVLDEKQATFSAGLVQQVLRADITELPGIIKAMQGYRRWVDPALRDEYRNAPEDSPQRLHASLALLPVDSHQAEYLSTRLLKASPSELPVILRVLEDHHQIPVGRLWSVLENPQADADQRLRAACALASDDTTQKKRAWESVSPFVADQLLATVIRNPSHYTPLVEMLRPVSDRLIGPLTTIFRGKHRPESERSLATGILADFAADQASVIANLVMDATPSQFPILFPKAQAQAEQVRALLQAEIAKTVTPAWHDSRPASSWTKPDPIQVKKIEAAQGVLTDHFAFCQTMPLDDFLSVAEGLRGSGYRPTRLRPYKEGGSVQVAAIWDRDGLNWQTVSGLNAEQTQEKDREFRSHHLLPVDVVGYVCLGTNGEEIDCYTALWVEQDNPDDDARMYLAVNSADLNAVHKPLKDEHYTPRTLQATKSADGKVKYCGVWQKLSKSAAWHFYRGLDDAGYEESMIAQVDKALFDVSVSEAAASDRLFSLLQAKKTKQSYAAVWCVSPVSTSVESHGLDTANHLVRCREFISQGYRPVAISAVETTTGQPPTTASVWHLPVIPGVEKDALAKRQANAAVALARLGRTENTWPLLRHSIDPSLRNYVVHYLSLLGADPKVIGTELDRDSLAGSVPNSDDGKHVMEDVLFHPKTSVRRALILALGEYNANVISPEERQKVITRLMELYQNDPDAGIHGAAEWTLRRWDQAERLMEADSELMKLKEWGGRRWFINGQGQTMAVIDGPVDSVLGASWDDPDLLNDDEGLYHIRISRRFAIATKEVTLEQYGRDKQDHSFRSDRFMKKYSPDPEGPQILVSWYDAAAYCNWLSKEEGLPPAEWCYEPNENGEYAKGMKIPADCLKRRGYRLPTQAEWEYACRAGSRANRFYGWSEDLLEKYAWYVKNSDDHAWSVGTLKPNDFGLFDMLGNVWEWCQYKSKDFDRYPKSLEQSVQSNEVVQDNDVKLNMGASFVSYPPCVRPSHSHSTQPVNRYNEYGIRPVRTLP